MNTSVFIAQLLAIVYLSVGVGMFIDPKYYYKTIKSVMSSELIYYLGGVMALVAGFLILTFHNVWIKSWEVIITIIGLIAVIKGFALLAFPSAVRKFHKGLPKNADSVRAWSVFVLILGIILGYFGFIV